jgi:hypothetical protein
MTLDEAIKHCEKKAEELEKRLKPYQCVSINKKLYEVNKKEWDSCLECAKEHRQLATWLKELKQLKEQMNSSDEPNEWIPLSKEMPIIGEDVLLCDLDGDIYISYLHIGGRWGFEYCGNEIKNIVAWMPLPLPYKAESEE